MDKDWIDDFDEYNMDKIIVPAEQYIELTSSLADAILQSTYLDRVFVEDDNGDQRYSEDAQDSFNEHLSMVCDHLSAHKIFKKGEETNTRSDDWAAALFLHAGVSKDDGQPDEAQEWHDFDPDC